ncbi:MAG: hypothetical protein WCJ35_13105 [Planctomycetota bacterium]
MDRETIQKALELAHDRWNAFLDGSNPETDASGGWPISELVEELESALDEPNEEV